MIFKDNLIKAKDHLVSGEVFEIYWDPSKGIAKTQIPSGLNLSRYYESQDYTSHNEKGTSFIDKIYFVGGWCIISLGMGSVSISLNS